MVARERLGGWKLRCNGGREVVRGPKEMCGVDVGGRFGAHGAQSCHVQ